MSTSIEWTDETWNPIAAYDTAYGNRGWFCTKVSPGCKNCYAEKINLRLGNNLLYREGNRTQVRHRLVNLNAPLKWRKPRRVFVCSMTDLFHEDHPDEIIREVFATMHLAHQHTFQVLTKRPERMAALVPTFADRLRAPDGSWWPLPNVWLGTSVEDQERADERIPHLLKTPAAVRFLSVEPLLGPVDLFNIELLNTGLSINAFESTIEATYDSGIHWVIIGGESGPGARPFNIAWAEQILADCHFAGVPAFLKQLGARPFGFDGCACDVPRRAHVPGCPGSAIRDKKGGDPAEWPEHLRVRQFPQPKG